MKKQILLFCLAIILLFSGCTISFEFGTRPLASPMELEPITFVLPREWQEQNPTPELQVTIDKIRQFVEENPYMGVANDFWISHIGSEDQDLGLTWLVVNRTGRGMQNIFFDLTLIRADETYVVPIELTEDFIGIIPAQTATVFTLNFSTEEGFEHFLTLLHDAEDGTARMSLDNFTSDSADE